MITNLIWASAIALETVILFRGLGTALLKKYLLFYAYVGCVLLTEILRLCCHKFAPNSYPAFYWYSDLVTIVASYAIIYEVFRQGLRHNPGVAKLAGKLLVIIFVIAFTCAASNLLYGGFASVPRATANLGRYLRYVEGALLLVMLWLFGRYRISFGRNLIGLTIGYSLFVGLDVMNSGFLLFPGNELSRRLAPITYLITLVIWCVSLWSSHPDSLQPEEST